MHKTNVLYVLCLTERLHWHLYLITFIMLSFTCCMYNRQDLVCMVVSSPSWLSVFEAVSNSFSSQCDQRCCYQSPWQLDNHTSPQRVGRHQLFRHNFFKTFGTWRVYGDLVYHFLWEMTPTVILYSKLLGSQDGDYHIPHFLLPPLCIYPPIHWAKEMVPVMVAWLECCQAAVPSQPFSELLVISNAQSDSQRQMVFKLNVCGRNLGASLIGHAHTRGLPKAGPQLPETLLLDVC